MPVYGVGIDIVVVRRLGKSLERWGHRFAKRVFTDFELEYCSGRKNRAACLAMRFAAKEAFVKALGLGMRKPLLWQDIEIRPDGLGKPEIFLSPRALDYCEQKGIRSWHLSLTDEGEYAAAVVIAET
ncbi:MAG: holo-ACP synthase [Syntrophobacteraceae bacterium]